MRIQRPEVLRRLQNEHKQGRPIIGAGAGTGLSAAAAEAGGVDLLIVYNSGRYRMAGRGSAAGLLAYGDANATVMGMASEVLPVVRQTPVLAGVCGTDPFREMPDFLDEIKRIGFSGVQNFPTVGLLEGQFRQSLEETGMGYVREIDMIRLAHERDLLTAPYVFDAEQAREMTIVGADVLVPHLGTTVSGMIGAKSSLDLDEGVARIMAMHDSASAVNPHILVLCHGGPIVEPEHVAYVLESCPGIAGFFGASSIERLPVERAIAQKVRDFKAVAMRAGNLTGGGGDRGGKRGKGFPLGTVGRSTDLVGLQGNQRTKGRLDEPTDILERAPVLQPNRGRCSRGHRRSDHTRQRARPRRPASWCRPLR